MKFDAEVGAFEGWHRLARMAIGILVLGGAGWLFGLSSPSQQQVQGATQQPQQYPELPAGAGRDTLIRVCGQCHSPQKVAANGQNQQGWENTITKMAGYGATGSDADFSAILDYLVKNFPQSSAIINVNKATANQLESGLGLSPSEAGAIVEYREKNGDLTSFDDFSKIPDLDMKKLDAEKSRIAF